MIDESPEGPMSFTHKLIGKILSFQDRDPFSESFGCFDRNFWHYRSLNDFPVSNYQQVVLGLAHHWARTKNDATKARLAFSLRAGLLYWQKIQNPDGSFNEHYLHDSSYCPTAYSTFAAGQAFELCSSLFSESEKRRMTQAIAKACRWLYSHPYRESANQQAAAILALHWGSRVTGDPSLRDHFLASKAAFLSTQTAEGWFHEYGGFDPGYNMQVLELFSYLHSHAEPDPELEAAALRLIECLSHAVHPDSTIGGDSGSRGSSLYPPFAVKYWASRSPSAARLWHGYAQMRANEDILLNDDRILFHFLFNSQILADALPSPGPSALPDETCFPQTDMGGFRNVACGPESKARIDTRHTGNVTAFIKNTKIVTNGLDVRLLRGWSVSMNCGVVRSVRLTDHSDGEVEILIEGEMGIPRNMSQVTRWNWLFKLVQRTLLSCPRFARFFNVTLKKRLLKEQRLSGIPYQRVIRLKPASLSILNRVWLSPRLIANHHLNASFSTRVGVSSRIYDLDSLMALPPRLTETSTPDLLEIQEDYVP